MSLILENYRRIQAKIARHGKAPITVIAVSKTFSATAVRVAQAAGISDVGENYLQEAEEKIAACHQLPLTWHFIGSVQKRKCPRIARLFDWVHGVDRLSVAQSLSRSRAGLAPLNICIQVNTSDEQSKGGVAADAVLPLAKEIALLPHLRLRGLMAIPAECSEIEKQVVAFQQIAHLQAMLISEGIALDSLSMGMSNDFEQALRAGATHIRLGRSIFGARARKGE